MEKKLKQKFIIFLVGFIVGIAGFTISFVMYLKPSKENTLPEIPDKKEETIAYGDITFNAIDSSIKLDNAIPTLDKFGVMNKAFSFTIKNNSREARRYTLKLEDDDSTIMNKNIRYELTKNDKVIDLDTLQDDGILEISEIKSFEEIKYSIKIWLDYNSDVKVGRLSKKISISTDNGIKEEEFVNEPVLTDGMIPVYYDNTTNSWHKADNKNTYNIEWYNYPEQKWANVVTVNEEVRDEYLSSPIGTKILTDDINAYFVWIPRFSYDKNDGIIFVNNETKAYPAFTFNNNEISGFWISKFEAGMKEDSYCAKSSLPKECNDSNNKLYFVPNYLFVNRITMANFFYATRKMELKGNIYGFKNEATKLNNDGTIKSDSNNIDTHMIKNTEWQAVALLSSSKYGKYGNTNYDRNSKIIINNSDNYTGKATVNEEYFDYNVPLKGESASTTGNLYGVYDMSGGKREYVMVNNEEIDLFNKKSNSGFTNKILEYYYDNGFSDIDTTLELKEKYSKDNLINSEPITRGGYKSTGNIFNVYCAQDYLSKISLETNSRASLVIIEEK